MPQHMSAITDRPLYFRSFEAALRPPADAGAAGGGAITERALQLLETPWPWDTSCTSMGVCPPGAACAQTTGFAIICAQGIVRDSVEPALKAAREWWPTMLGGDSDSEVHLVAVVVATIMLVNLVFVARAVASRRAACQGDEIGVASTGGAVHAASRRQKDAAARRRSRRSRQQRVASDSETESESSDGNEGGESEGDSEIVAYKAE